MNTCKYEKYIKMASYDNGETWQALDEYQRGELIERDSVDCGWEPTPPTPPQYRWTDVSGYCEGVDYRILQKLQISYDEGVTWEDMVPEITQWVIEYDSEHCQPIPPTPEVEYRWVDLPLQEDYYCSGTTKYYKQKKQQSTDSGSTWSDVVPAEYRMGASAETQSSDCGYATRTTSGSPYCVGVDKCVDVYHQESEDSGTSWTTTSTTVSVIEYNSEDCGYVPPTPTPYESQYLTLRAREDGTFKFSKSGISYSLDSGESWTTLARNTNSPTVQSGSTIMWKGNLSTSTRVGTFSSSGHFDVEGNIMSLLYGDNFSGQTSLSGDVEAFYGLFSGCTKLYSAENLVLPATTLADGCYDHMFYGCTSLTTVPSDLLPAATLADSCYSYMFYNCSGLTVAPQLRATTLANYCYDHMFHGCTSLTTAPSVLPATTLGLYCYRSMFNGCTSLTTAPSLLATTLAQGCCQSMFYGCTSLTTAPSILPATTLALYCYQSMFRECTSLTTAPQLLATALGKYCYDSMFMDCTSLTTAPELLATTLAPQCYQFMFYNCTSLNSVTCLATNISATLYTSNWVRNVSPTGTFTKAASMTSWPSGDSGIPQNWTIQDAT